MPLEDLLLMIVFKVAAKDFADKLTKRSSTRLVISSINTTDRALGYQQSAMLVPPSCYFCKYESFCPASSRIALLKRPMKYESNLKHIEVMDKISLFHSNTHMFMKLMTIE